MNPKASKSEANNDSPDITIDFEQRIRSRAYELYVLRGGEHGRDIDDWLQAEAELMAERLQLPIEAKPRRERKAAKAPTNTPRVRTKRSRVAKQASTEEERGGD